VLPGPGEVDLRKLPAPTRDEVKGARTSALAPPSAPRMVPLSPAVRERGVGGSPAAIFASPPAARAATLTPPSAPRLVPLSPAVRERGVGGSPAAISASPPAARAATLTPPSAPRMVPLSPAVRERGVGGSPAATDLYRGSNKFAVSGALTRHGRANLADDIHLSLRAPGIWFRARLRYPDLRAPGRRVDVQGFTLPGLPAVVVGSNGHVAWGFTNSYVDTADWKRVHPCARANASPASCTPVTVHRERIDVAGSDAVALVVEDTAWGPILEHETDGSALALRWVAHLPGSLDFGLADMARAGDLEAALRIADRTAIPTQNLLLADSAGRIAWRLLGPLPQRTGGCSAQRLVEGEDPGAGAAAASGAQAQACMPWGISTAA